MPRAFVVGNISLDLILGGIDNFPEWGVEVLVPGYVMRPGGEGSNAALALADLGMETFVVGTVGRDETGEEITRSFRRRQIRTEFLFVEPDFQTGLSVALTHQETRERTFFTELGAQSALSLKHLEQVFPAVADGDFLLLCGYFLSPGIRKSELPDMLFQLKKEKRVTLFLDTGWPTEGWTEAVKQEVQRLLLPFDYFLPNEKEITGLVGSPEEIFRFFSGILLVKGGKEGCYCYTSSDSFSVPTISVAVQDTIGAGDYFDAGFIFALAQGYHLEKALFVANLVASLNIASSPRREKLVSQDEVKNYVKP
ncbi:MAG: carbohydrate kinase family protein [Candidatus Atribacteria bacterium]|nr:carbohydrate kinase family protein [Candidatus Atribacteria bacterium]